ncbi:hypothetical protein K8S19_08725 [bacterium]|nr:hypothetical protein [bacterium]
MKKIIMCLLLAAIPAMSFADIPNTLNYQGRLMDSVQQPVVDGQYSVAFRLYTAESGGTMVWEEAQSVATQNGYFNTVLGNSTALTPSIFNQSLWIGIQVGTNAEMTPRQKLGTSAYAMTVADGAITTEKIADGEVTSSKLKPRWTRIGTTSEINLTASELVELLETTITVDTPSVLLISSTVQLYHHTKEIALYIKLEIDSAQIPEAEAIWKPHYAQDDGFLITLPIITTYPVEAGSHNIKIYGYTANSTVKFQRGNLSVMAFGN